MSRFAATFERLRARGERALMPYFTAGDPSLEETRRLMLEAAKRGADVIELGVPFSDPLADGPVIQRAGLRALAGGTTLPRVLELVATLRAQVSAAHRAHDVLQPGVRLRPQGASPGGGRRRRRRADRAPTCRPTKSEPLRAEAEPVGLDLVQFVAPTSTARADAKAIARVSRGFIYVVSLTGVTGERGSCRPTSARRCATLRLVTTKPMCVGFGMSTPEQAAAVGQAGRRRPRRLGHRAPRRAPRRHPRARRSSSAHSSNLSRRHLRR